MPRFVSIWFPHLITDRMQRRMPELKDVPFIFSASERGRMIVKAANKIAESNGIHTGMVVADCRAILPSLQVFDHDALAQEKLLNALAEWCMRYSPGVAIDPRDGLLLDASGCAHLWGGESDYIDHLLAKLRGYGYHIQVAMADTVGCAWAIARYAVAHKIVAAGAQLQALMPLPSAALRLDANIIQRLDKLGLYQIQSFIKMPRAALSRRFGASLLTQLDRALGQEMEILTPIQPAIAYQERLPSLEPIRTATCIEIALKKLLKVLCLRLVKEAKGIRKCIFKCYRIDNNTQQIEIGTNKPSANQEHLFKLFEIKIQTIAPGLGIELFMLEAPIVEDITVQQDALWNSNNKKNNDVAELLDRLTGKLGINTIHRYLPDEHFWPERSLKLAATLEEEAPTAWNKNIPRPLQLLAQPELIIVTVAIPDYPPILFHYQGKLHTVKRADGPERIEQEWWIEPGLYRDYYCLEDEEGQRFWVFRLGHYYSEEPKWFLHGFFA